MKNSLRFLFFIGVITTFGLNLNSCSKTSIQADKPKNENREVASKIDFAADGKMTFFQMPSLQKLADESPVLKAEAFGNDNEQIRYIVGDIIILSVDKKIVYLNLLPKTSEDNHFYINLVIQNKSDNIPKIAKEWLINNEEGNSIILAEFYENYKDEILEILHKEKIELLNKNLSLKPYGQIEDTYFTSMYKTIENDRQVLSKVQINFSNQKSIFLDQNSKNRLCSECNSIELFKGDFLGELTDEDNSTRILVLGFLEQIDQSPNALHLRFLNLQ